MSRFFLVGALAAGLIGAPGNSVSGEEGDWTYLENEVVRLGINRAAGAAIGWFSAADSKENLLNHHDHGRYLQQSWYGDSDGSDWNGKPWVWNPVQGGGWRGEPAKTLEWKQESDISLYARTRPVHWAKGTPVPDILFEQWIELEGPIACIRFRMKYTGNRTNAPRHQELPAVFINDRFTTLVHYDGELPWTGGDLSRSTPGWPNEERNISENWAAYIDPESKRGIGVYVPGAERITCYRFGVTGQKGACSYLAPVKTLAITPGFTFEYRVWLTSGTVPEMRSRFAAIRDQQRRALTGKDPQ